MEGKSGTLEMSVVGKRPEGATEWEGKWVILSGTEELATLRGQGTWWGPGASEFGVWGDIYQLREPMLISVPLSMLSILRSASHLMASSRRCTDSS